MYLVSNWLIPQKIKCESNHQPFSYQSKHFLCTYFKAVTQKIDWIFKTLIFYEAKVRIVDPIIRCMISKFLYDVCSRSVFVLELGLTHQIDLIIFQSFSFERGSFETLGDTLIKILIHNLNCFLELRLYPSQKMNSFGHRSTCLTCEITTVRHKLEDVTYLRCIRYIGLSD